MLAPFKGRGKQRASPSSSKAAIDMGQKLQTVPAQTAQITKCHVIFIVFFKYKIEIGGGDGINQFL